MPIDELEDDGYPNDWFVPPSSRAAPPSDWTYPANWLAPAPPAPPGTAQPSAFNPTPINPAALRPDPSSAFWPPVWGSDSLGMPFTPPTFPDAFGRFPAAPFPPLSGFPQVTPVPGLFGFVPDPPKYGLFNLTLTPTGPVAPPSIAASSARQGPFGTPPGLQPIPNFSSSPFSNPAFQTISGFTDQLSGTSASGNPLGLASTPPLQLPMVGSFSSLGPTALLPTDFSAPPIADPQSVSFANPGSSLGAPAGANGDLLARILNFLNPISPAYAADDEGEIPPAELEALLHLLNPEVAQRLSEINRSLEEFRRDLEEVRAGRGSSRALARYLEISGVKRPPGYAAHHIAAGNDPRGEVARNVLQRFGIGINDAVNGVFLPANKATQVIAGKTIHSTLHTQEYYDAVNEALSGATTRQQVIDTLRTIAKALEAGEYP